ncbi:MAG: hypothetical protein JO022_17825 [Acidobacteriaceae bacterium]|nr:hypothetical protein [Acidobacteriaceae bacterium]
MQFSTANYITGRSPGDALFATPTQVQLKYTLGSAPPSAALQVGAFGSHSLSFTTQTGTFARAFASMPIPNLSVQAAPCCNTPSTLNISLFPAYVPPGNYSSELSVIPINVIAQPVLVEVDLTVTAPPTWLTTSATSVTFPGFTRDNPPSAPLQLKITSLGAAQNFTIQTHSVTPAGVNWFTVSPVSGATPTTLNITFNASALSKMARGTFVGYFDIVAPGAPDSPLRIMVFATVFPNTDFTLDPPTLTFAYTLGDPAAAPQTVGLDGVSSPIANTQNLSFTTSVATANGDPIWLHAAPAQVCVAGNSTCSSPTMNVSLDSTVVNSLATGAHVAYLNLTSPANTGDTTDDPTNSTTAAYVTVNLNVSPAPPSTSITQVLSQIADGGGWQTKIVLVNTDTVNAAPFTLRFWPGQDTPPTLVPVLTTGALNDFTLSDTIPAGGSKTYLTQGSTSGPLWQGWGELYAPRSVGGTAVFRQSVTADQDEEGAVPLKPPDGTRFVLPFDCTSTSGESYVTSMAIINSSGDQSTNVTASAYDTNGVPISLPSGPSSIPLTQKGHAAFAVCGGSGSDRLGALTGKQGTLVFSNPSASIAGLGLRFSSRNAFTSIGTLTTGNMEQRIAQVADGGLWKTGIVIVNMDSVQAGVTIRFYRSTLTSPGISLSLENPGLVGSVYTSSTNIPPNGSLWLATQGTSNNLWEGWADVTSNANINGFAIFRHRPSDAGDSEGAVPFTVPGGNRFLLPFDNTNGFVTSMAMVSPDSSQATITAAFRDPTGATITPGYNTMSLTGHTAFALTDSLPFYVGGSGVADFTTTGTELFGIGLLFNPKNSFTSVPILKR